MHLLLELHGAARVGGGAEAAVGGRDDRRALDDSAGRLAVGWPWRDLAVGAAGVGQRGERGRQCRGRRADCDRYGTALLLGALREAGADEQAAVLLARDPAAHASLDA